MKKTNNKKLFPLNLDMDLYERVCIKAGDQDKNITQYIRDVLTEDTNSILREREIRESEEILRDFISFNDDISTDNPTTTTDVIEISEWEYEAEPKGEAVDLSILKDDLI